MRTYIKYLLLVTIGLYLLISLIISSFIWLNQFEPMVTWTVFSLFIPLCVVIFKAELKYQKEIYSDEDDDVNDEDSNDPGYEKPIYKIPNEIGDGLGSGSFGGIDRDPTTIL